MHFTCRSFLCKTTPTSWSQYWENEPDNQTIVSQKGHLFGLINLNTPSESDDISKIGHQIIDDINTHYFSSSSNIPLSLEEAIKSVNTNDISLLLAVVLKNRLYLAVYNLGHVIFVRRDKIAHIISGKPKEIVPLSGSLESEDKFILATDDLFQAFTWPKIKTLLADDHLQTLEENFLSTLYSFDNQSNQAAVLIQAHMEENEDVSPVSLPAPSIPVLPVRTIQFKPHLPSLPKINPLSLVKRIFRKKPVFVSYHDITEVNKRKKINLATALILLVGLCIASYFGYQKNRAASAESNYQQLKTELEEKLKNASVVKNLNLDSALELARQSQSTLDKMKALKIHQSELSSYEESIRTLLSVTGSSENFAPDLFYDTSLIADNPSYSKIIFDSSSIYLLDAQKGRVDILDASQKNIKNLIINDKVKQYTNLVADNGSIYLISNDGLALASKTDIVTKINFSNASSSAAPIDSQFWNGAFYLLTPVSIEKYSPNAAGFGAAQNWLKDNQVLAAQPSSLAINGKVWALSMDGTITPYVRGIKDNFKPSQAVSAANANNLVTATDSEILAFTDAENLIYVYKKDGEVLARYNLGGKKIADIALDEKQNLIFVLCTDQKIYKIIL